MKTYIIPRLDQVFLIYPYAVYNQMSLEEIGIVNRALGENYKAIENNVFGENVPFDTEFTTTIPMQKKYKINALEKDRIKIGKNAELHLLNFDEVNEVRKKLMKQNNGMILMQS